MMQFAVGARFVRALQPTRQAFACMLKTHRRGFASKQYINVTFVKPNDTEVTVKAPVGDSLLEIAHANNIDIEGACGGETACSTCHVILPADVYEKLPSPTPEEEDMLDLAAGLTKTSRLGCQVIAAPELDGMRVALPKEVYNMLSS